MELISWRALGHGSGLWHSPGNEVNIHSRSCCHSGLYGNVGLCQGFHNSSLGHTALQKK